MLKPTELKKIKKEAQGAAYAASEILMRYWRKKFTVAEKYKAGLVTEADVKSENLIRKRLQKAFPDFVFLGEESGRSRGGNADTPVWHVDPLDGTTNFVHGFPMFCISIGLAIRNQPLVGVIYIPPLNEMIHGAYKQGSFFNKKPMKVSKRSKLNECLFTTGFAYLDEEQQLEPELERFKRISLSSRAVRRPGAAAIDLAYVAAGIFDGFWEKNLSSWDICAGSLLVSEAGGCVTDFSGKPVDFEKREILATNAEVHDRMQLLLK
jgi:myo-inositol-1(or 4)-monophosphatase